MANNQFKIAVFILFITAIGSLVSITAGTVVVRYSGNIVSDAGITSGSPFFNGGNDGWGNVTFFSSNGNTERTYLFIPIPNLIYNVSPSRITKACINITFTGLQSDSFRICLNEVLNRWNESLIGWNNQPSFNDTALDTITLLKPSAFSDTVVSFDITRLLVKYMISEKIDISVLFKALTENPPEDNLCVLSTSDNSNYLQWPSLIIESPDLPDTLISDGITSIKQNAFNHTKVTSEHALLNPLVFQAGRTMQKHSPVFTVHKSDKVIYNISGRKLIPLFP